MHTYPGIYIYVLIGYWAAHWFKSLSTWNPTTGSQALITQGTVRCVCSPNALWPWQRSQVLHSRVPVPWISSVIDGSGFGNPHCNQLVTGQVPKRVPLDERCLSSLFSRTFIIYPERRFLAVTYDWAATRIKMLANGYSIRIYDWIEGSGMIMGLWD